VRCGHCHTIFDGSRNKIEAPPDTSAAPVPAKASAENARRTLLARLGTRVAPPPHELELPLRPPPDRRPPAAPATPAARPVATPPGNARAAAAPQVASERDTAAPERRRSGIGRSLFSLLIIFLLLGAALQYAWWERENFRVVWPPSEVAYQAVCRITGCKLTPIHDIDLLQIADMSLRQIDDPRHLALALTLRNRVGLTLAYPSVELTLTDSHNHATIRKVIAPAQYLNDPAQQENGIGPHVEQTLRMRVDTATVPASNYRVKIFYP
jgi:Protein of unknown function (DUF3426)